MKQEMLVHNVVGFRTRKPIRKDIVKHLALLRILYNERTKTRVYSLSLFGGNGQTRIQKYKPRITMSLGGSYTSFKKINGELRHPDYRIPSEEDRKEIQRRQEEIRDKREELKEFVEEKFMTWELVTLEQAEEMIKNYLDNMEDQHKRLRISPNFHGNREKVLNQIEGKDKTTRDDTKR